MRAASMLLGVSVIAGAGCLSLSATDPSTGGAGGTGMGGAGGVDTSSSVSSGTPGSGGNGNGGVGGGCVSNSPCNTGKMGVCADGLLSCEQPQACIQIVPPSVENCATTEDESCDGVANCTGETTFSARYGGISGQSGTDVAVDSKGNVLVTGVVTGSIDLGGGNLASAGGDDIFVAKFDPLGNHIWSRVFGDGQHQRARAIAVDDDDNVFIGGVINGTLTFGADMLDTSDDDAFIAKLDPDGNPLWAKYAQAPGGQVFEDIATDSNGNVIGVGYVQGTANFGSGDVGSAGEDDILVAKFGPGGANLWTESFGGASDREWATAVATDTKGDIYVTGGTTKAVNFDGPSIPFGGDIDGYLVKFDSQGDAIWAKGFGADGDQAGIDITTDKDNDVLLSIIFEGTVNLGGGTLPAPSGITESAVVKFDSTGQHRWSNQFGQSSDSNGVFIAVDDGGNILLTIAFQGMIDLGVGPLMASGTDMAFAKLGPTGNAVFAHRFGSANTKVLPSAIAAGPSGNAWVVGMLLGTVNFGQGTLSAATNDMFLVGFSP